MNGAWRTLASICLLGVSLAGVAGCGGKSSGGKSVKGDRLVIYTSLPLRGPYASTARDVLDGERLALKDAGSRAGNFSVELKPLDDTAGSPPAIDPVQLSKNARTAAQDPKTIAYIGEYAATTSSIPVPILNSAGILTVTPGDTALGLTRSEQVAKGEPEKYYPTSKRTFARVIPADQVQSTAIAAYMRDKGVSRLAIISDNSAYAQSLIRLVTVRLRGQGIRVVSTEVADPDDESYTRVAGLTRVSGAQGVLFAGTSTNQARRLWKTLAVAGPSLKLFAPNVLALPAFAEGVGSAAKNTYVLRAAIDPKLDPPEAARVLDRFESTYGRRPATEALFGYEAMSAVLASIKSAGDDGNKRGKVIDEFFGISNRQSVLGTYSIDDQGDTTLDEYGGYRIEGGKLVFDKVLRGAP
jgi:branched-chain amino acid transport system substrate-binding protein